MRIVLSLINRNLKVFLRNKTSVFFSFFVVLIIIGLYALFLGDNQISNIKHYIELTNKDALVSDKDIGWLVNSWLMAGLISVNVITIILGTYGTIVHDIERGNNKDFLSSPIKRTHLVLGYIISSWILAFLLSLIGFIAIELYVVFQGGQLLSIMEILQTLIIIIISIISFSAVLFFIVTFVKSSNSFGTLSSIVGTLIGFLAGIYIPVGVLPNFAKTIVTIFPVSYSASMLRQIFTKDAMNQVFSDAPSQALIYKEVWGVNLYYNGTELTWTFMIIVLILIGVLFYALSVFRLIRNKTV